MIKMYSAKTHPAFVETCAGAEQFVALELKHYGLKPDKIYKGAVTFSAGLKDIIKAAYVLQTAARISLLVSDLNIQKNIQNSDFELDLKKQDMAGLKAIQKMVPKDSKFKVSSTIMDSCPYSNTTEANAKIGAVIFACLKEAGLNPEVSLDEPDIQFACCFTSGRMLIGIDLCSIELSKRDYKVFPSRTSLKAVVAFCAVLASGFSGKEVLLDPFCNDGTIAIEAGIFASKSSHNKFRKKDLRLPKSGLFAEVEHTKIMEDVDNSSLDKIKGKIHAVDGHMPNVAAAKKNAKIADVEKFILFSRTSVDWNDTKFAEGEIDIICTYIPQEKADRNESLTEKNKTELFYQADYIINKNGTIALLHESEINQEIIDRYKFALKKQHEIMQGAKKMMLSIYKRK